MEMKDWLKALRKCKRVQIHTANSNIKVYRYQNGKLILLRSNKKCKCCGNTQTDSVIVSFNKPTKLTIFQANTLFLMFAKQEKPVDYAEYHKCPAGKEFIESIVEVI